MNEISAQEVNALQDKRIIDIYDYVVTNREEDFITKIMFKLTSKHFYTNL